ncbi:MAG: 4Fe-4S binding protein [Clostridiales bacterium]|nr:4Fe-4S binding protein [Clostridiales bacterium]
MNVFSFSKTTLKNLFSAPATRPYPQQPRQYPERTRGHVEIDIEHCVFCGLCSRKCPADAIRVDRAAGTWSIERFGCIQCSYCVDSCPKKCLSMKQTYTAPAPEKSVDTYQKKPAAPAKEPEAAPKGENEHA